MPSTQLPSAARPALITSDTSIRKPSVKTRPMLAARARTSRDRPAFGSAFQILFSDDWISPKAPLAVISNVTRPMIVAIAPVFWFCEPALCSIDCNAWPLPWPIIPLNWPMIAACAASRPNTSPAIAMTTSSKGAIEKIVK